MSGARVPAGNVITRQATTAAKIRALAEAGYDRIEISRLLGIRYQHVRTTFLRAGMTGGLRRQVEASREPVTIDVAAPRKTTSWKTLRRAGFQSLGEWAPAPDGAIHLRGTAPAEPGVYAFVLDEVVVYVGLTNNGLKARLNDYRRGHAGQRTSARVKGLIAHALASGQKVKILAATPSDQDWHGLPVNTAAGLEAGLIQTIRPAWNIVGAA